MAAALVRLEFQRGADMVAERSSRLHITLRDFGSQARRSGAHAHGAVGAVMAAAGRGSELCGGCGLGGCGCGGGGRCDGGVGGARADWAVGAVSAASGGGGVGGGGGLGGCE